MHYRGTSAPEAQRNRLLPSLYTTLTEYYVPGKHILRLTLESYTTLGTSLYNATDDRGSGPPGPDLLEQMESLIERS